MSSTIFVEQSSNGWTRLTVYRRRFFSRKGFLPCSQMGTPAELRLNKQYNLDTFFLK